MQTQLIQNAGPRAAEPQPATKDYKPSPTDFSAVLGSLFAVVTAGQSPPAAREASPQARPEPVQNEPAPTWPDHSLAPDPRGKPAITSGEGVADRAPGAGNTLQRSGDSSRQDPEVQARRESADPPVQQLQAATPRPRQVPSPLLPVGTPDIPAPSGTSPGSELPEVPLSNDPTGPVAGASPPSTDVVVAVPGLAANVSPAAVEGSSSSSAPQESMSPVVSASGLQAGPAAPSLRTAMTGSPLAPSSVERMATAIRTQAAMGGGKVKILLHPPHLGALKIEVSVRDSVVFARMEADSQSARHSLQQHQSDLKQALEERGLSLGQMSVSVSQGDGNGREAQFASASAPLAFEAEPEAVSDSRPEAQLPHLLDVTV